MIFLIPLLLYLPDHYGLDGVWMSFPISDCMATTVTVIMVSFELARLNRAVKEHGKPNLCPDSLES